MTARSTLRLVTTAAQTAEPGSLALNRARVRFQVPAGSEFIDGRIKVPFGANLTLVITGTGLAKLNLRTGATVDGALTVHRSKENRRLIESCELIVEDGAEPIVELTHGRTDAGVWRKPIFGNGYLCLERIPAAAEDAQTVERQQLAA